MSHFDEKAELVEAKAPQYTWKQSLEEVQVFVPVPAGTRGKQIQCDVKTNKLLLIVCYLGPAEQAKWAGQCLTGLTIFHKHHASRTEI